MYLCVFGVFYLAVRADVTVVDSFIYWFLCEAEKEHKWDKNADFIYKSGYL